MVSNLDSATYYLLVLGMLLLTLGMGFGNKNNLILLGFIETLSLKLLVHIIWSLNVTYFFFILSFFSFLRSNYI